MEKENKATGFGKVIDNCVVPISDRHLLPSAMGSE